VNINPISIRNQFARFIQSRAIGRHFRRLTLFNVDLASPATSELPPELTAALKDASHTSLTDLPAKLGSHIDGLTYAQADQIRRKVGANEIEQEKPLPWYVHLVHCYKTPFDLLLTLLAAISYYTQDIKAATVIATMVVISVSIRFWQERKSSQAADELKAMVSNTATVIRRNLSEDAAPDARKYFSVQLQTKTPARPELPIRQIVPGDVVLLSAGDMIPADCRILAAKDLFVSQSAMTGESLPVEKFAQATVADASVGTLELNNIAFMGTNVVSGSATAIVIHTGSRTYFGALAQRVGSQERAPTQFQTGINQVAWLLIRFMFVMSPLVLLVNGFTKGDWVEAALFSMSIAVGLTPEMLPMIVTSTLAKGAVILSRQKVIVKRLDAIQNFGAMDVLCTDKTGTLTQDKIFLARHIDAWGQESDEELEYAYLNSHYQTGLKNLLDVAVLEHAHINTLLDPANTYEKIDEVPFDFSRRRMSVVVESTSATSSPLRLLVCKGAVEETLAVCQKVRHGDVDEALSPELLQHILSITSGLNADGLRVVAVATRVVDAAQTRFGIQDECDLTLAGYIAFLDPPKESAAPAIRALADHGVKVKVLTGDNELVTTKICHEVGIDFDKALLGSAIEQMSDNQLATAVETHAVFVKLTPSHKERIVRLLKANGHVVGFMGDGINDAPALRTADIGISVDTGVDIAKEAADIILLEKSLMVLEHGVIEGRKTFANMLKYIKMTVSSNFGNVFSVLVASAAIPFLPMLPMHLLVQNLLYDFSQVAIPFDNVDEELVRMPQHWNSPDIGRFMVFFGPVSSLLDIATFAILWFVFDANSVSQQTLFQSGWFIEGLMTQTLVVHMIRTRKVPFFQSHASWPLMGMTLLIILVGIFLPMGPLAHYFKMQALPWSYFPILGLVLVVYMVLIQAMKGYYTKRFGWH